MLIFLEVYGIIIGELYSQRRGFQMNNDSTNYSFITELNGEITELSEQEVELLLEFRMSDSEEQAEIINLVKAAMSNPEISDRE